MTVTACLPFLSENTQNDCWKNFITPQVKPGVDRKNFVSTEVNWILREKSKLRRCFSTKFLSSRTIKCFNGFHQSLRILVFTFSSADDEAEVLGCEDSSEEIKYWIFYSVVGGSPSFFVLFLMDSEITFRSVGRRKEGEQKSGKRKKGESGNKHGGKEEGGRSRSGSQGNGSSGVEGSGEGSGNGDESSDDDDEEEEEEEDDDEEEDQDEEEEDDEEDDEMEEDMEEDTDNVSAMAEDETEEATNGCVESQTEQKSDTQRTSLLTDGCNAKVAATTLVVHGSDDVKDDESNGDDQSTVAFPMVPVQPGTPVTLSGVIWKETMGGVLVVNLKWRNKTYSGSLIDHSRHDWANPRNLEEAAESELSNSSRGCKEKRGKHKGAAYTGNPLSPKMSGNGKRGPRFHRNKGKHNKESCGKSKTKRSLETGEEGARTRRRSCAMKTTVSPSPSPTPLIECPERNCNKKYKHINGLRYHRAHAHLDSVGDGDDKDSDDEDLKEPLSIHSKSSGSDDVKPLSHRKAKNQKSSTKPSEAPPPPRRASAANGEKSVDAEENEEKFDVVDVKIEEVDAVKVEEKTSSKSNILEEAVKMIFDEPTTSQEIVDAPGIFSRMTSQALLGTSHLSEYSYGGYETMAGASGSYTEKTGSSGDGHGLDVTVKEEVIDEGHAGDGKVSGGCKVEAGETFKLENVEMCFNAAKSHDSLAGGENGKTVSNDDTKWLSEKSPKPVNPSRKGDGASVAKEQIKSSAAEIRSLKGYTHFRLTPNINSGLMTQATQDKNTKSLTLDTGLLDSKEQPKGPLIRDNVGMCRQERTAEKPGYKTMVWKVHGGPSSSSASFQLTCENKERRVTASTTWVPEVHPSLMTKMSGTSLPGQEVVPEKSAKSREAPEKMTPLAYETAGETEEEKIKVELAKGEDERSKGTYSGKPGRAVGVAHPFNAEKSQGEFPVGMVGSITSDPVRVLYSKSSSPKMSVDVSHPDMTEVKKVRVEKTLEVPVGEVVPLAKTSRTAVADSGERDVVVVGSEFGGHFSNIPAPDDRLPRIEVSSPVLRETQLTASAEHASPWRPRSGPSPLVDHEPRSRGENSQRYAMSESISSQQRKPFQHSPVPDPRATSFRSIAGGYLVSEMERNPDSPGRLSQHLSERKLPFWNMEDRLAQRDVAVVADTANIARSSPSKVIPGSLFSRGRSPGKDTSGSLHPKTADRRMLRDVDRSSPRADTMSRLPYSRSPIRERRSPGHARRSPDREMVDRIPYRDTSPNPLRDTARHSPFREQRGIKAADESEVISQRKDALSPIRETRTGETLREYRARAEEMISKDARSSKESQRSLAESKFPRISNEEAAMMMQQARNALYQYQATSPQDGAAARESFENYMMYLSRMHIPTVLSAYPMTQFLLPSASKETSIAKDERLKELPDDARRKSSYSKPDIPRSRGESSGAEIVTGKRHAEGTRAPSSSRNLEKTEYESSPSKRSKTAEVKDAHEIMDEREGGRMQLKTLEKRALQQALQHKIDGLNQLQTEKNLKMKAEDRSGRAKPSSNSLSSRLKPSNQESRTLKREDKGFSKEEKSRLSPVNFSSGTMTSDGSGGSSRTRFPENRSPAPSTPSSTGGYMGLVSAPNLPANHALSNSYEQAMAMSGLPPFIMSSPFHLPPGMMMASPLVPGTSRFHSAITARGLDTKRETSRSSSSTSTDRARPRDDDRQEYEARDFSSQTKGDVSSNNSSRINPSSPSSRVERDKERTKEKRGSFEHDEEKPRTMRDISTLHGQQSLPSNLAFRRGNMSDVIDPALFGQVFPGMIYPPSPGTYRPSYEHSFTGHPRK